MPNKQDELIGELRQIADQAGVRGCCHKEFCIHKQAQAAIYRIDEQKSEIARLADEVARLRAESGGLRELLSKLLKASMSVADDVKFSMRYTRQNPGANQEMIEDDREALRAFEGAILAAGRTASASTNGTGESQADEGHPFVTDILDRWEAEADALPMGHESQQRGKSTYNWTMHFIRKMRDELALASESGKEGQDEGWGAAMACEKRYARLLNAFREIVIAIHTGPAPCPICRANSAHSNVHELWCPLMFEHEGGESYLCASCGQLPVPHKGDICPGCGEIWGG